MLFKKNSNTNPLFDIEKDPFNLNKTSLVMDKKKRQPTKLTKMLRVLFLWILLFGVNVGANAIFYPPIIANSVVGELVPSKVASEDGESSFGQLKLLSSEMDAQNRWKVVLQVLDTRSEAQVLLQLKTAAFANGQEISSKKIFARGHLIEIVTESLDYTPKELNIAVALIDKDVTYQGATGDEAGDNALTYVVDGDPDQIKHVEQPLELDSELAASERLIQTTLDDLKQKVEHSKEAIRKRESLIEKTEKLKTDAEEKQADASDNEKEELVAKVSEYIELIENTKTEIHDIQTELEQQEADVQSREKDLEELV